jgi:1-aminocyclopropane-1-carboxylate deaminase/D-cysteine desulfhydrase-like pyridoxal-dependent ACC family enzyme
LTYAGHAVEGVTATEEFHVPSRTAAIANATLEVLGLDTRLSEDEIRNGMRFVGPGYGIPTEACVDAVKLFARTEGVILDPIYTGKAAAGMIVHIREGRYGKDDALVFVHTGGTPAIFTWNLLWV